MFVYIFRRLDRSPFCFIRSIRSIQSRFHCQYLERGFIRNTHTLNVFQMWCSSWCSSFHSRTNAIRYTKNRNEQRARRIIPQIVVLDNYCWRSEITSKNTYVNTKKESFKKESYSVHCQAVGPESVTTMPINSHLPVAPIEGGWGGRRPPPKIPHKYFFIGFIDSMFNICTWISRISTF